MFITGIVLAIGGPFLFYWIFKRLPGSVQESDKQESRNGQGRPNAA